MEDKIQEEYMLKVGTTLSNGKYRIDQYLASGGFGNTYVATNTAFDEKVAIKELFIKGVCGRQSNSTEISVSLTENQRAFTAQQEKFRKEARRLRKLNNPHIVTVHDLFDENGTSYYVMDFIEGENLSTRVKRTKQPMTEANLMLIVDQILDALECVHNEEIWHLDLKPANIMIDALGNVQLIDFGASKQLRNANGDSLSTSSAMAYTPGYASSEQMEQNIEKFGPWTDLYSLGATMYHLLTLQQPPSPSDIFEDSREALKLPDNINKKTEKLIFWLMEPNRNMRPKSVTEVKQFLMEDFEEKKAPNKIPEDPLQYDAQSEKLFDSNDADDTIVKIPKTKAPSSPTPRPKPRDWKKTFVISVFAAICLAGGFLTVRTCNSSPHAAQDTLQSETSWGIKYVTDQPITVTSGPEHMRTYLYTGNLVDTLGALPNGKGIAKYEKYDDIPASTYEGNFVDGVCHDTTKNAIQIFSDGEKFTGSFVNGYYEQGRFYEPLSNTYFEGTFVSGRPFNGYWYKASGTKDMKVVNGKETQL